MTNISLAQSYLRKAVDRLDVLELLLRKGAYSDVIREGQEIVELAQKAMLRQVGIDPPKWHDVGSILKEKRALLPAAVRRNVEKLADISKWLRKERELSFYGDIDFIPTEEYSVSDARRAIKGALFTIQAARKMISLP